MKSTSVGNRRSGPMTLRCSDHTLQPSARNEAQSTFSLKVYSFQSRSLFIESVLVGYMQIVCEEDPNGVVPGGQVSTHVLLKRARLDWHVNVTATAVLL